MSRPLIVLAAAGDLGGQEGDGGANTGLPKPEADEHKAINTTRYLAFMSHKQSEMSDRCNNVYQELRLSNVPPVWFDLAQETVIRATMEAGVRESALFVLFASTGYVDSEFCLLELKCAIREKKSILLIYDEFPLDSWCVTDDNLSAWLASLHSHLSDTDVSLSLEEFQASLTRNTHYYGMRRGSETRTLMLNTLMSLGGGPSDFFCCQLCRVCSGSYPIRSDHCLSFQIWG